MDAPYVEEYSLIVECRLREAFKLGSHTMFVGEIIGIKADEDVLTNDNPDIQKIKPILFSFGERSYHSIGSRIANAFSIRTPPIS